MNRIQRRWLQITLITLMVALVLVLMYTQRMIFNPLLLALVIAYILNPVINSMERRGVPRKSAVVLLLTLLSVVTLAATVTLIPLVGHQARGWYAAFFGEPFSGDRNNNGSFDPLSERDTWNDLNDNGVYDGPGSFTTTSSKGIQKPSVPGAPINSDQISSSKGEPYTDFNDNNQFDPDLPADDSWDDLNQNGVYDEGYLARLIERVANSDDEDKGSLLKIIHTAIPRERWAPLVRTTMTGLKENLKNMVTGTQAVLGTAMDKGLAAAGQIWNLLLLLLLTPIYLCFLLYGMRNGWESFVAHIPAKLRPRFLQIALKIDIVIGAFFRGRLLVCTAISVFTALGFLLCGVKFGLLFGLIIGVTSFIPFLNIIPFLLTLLVCWLDEMGWGGLGAVLGVYLLGQGIDPLLMTLVMGKELQLHPVTILLSMFVCASLLGFFGMLLAVPIVAVGKILFTEFILPHLRELAEESVE